MAYVTEQIKEAFTTNGNGDVALRVQVEGDQDLNGGYILNEQGRADHVANTMPSPYYRTDGSDDYISLDSLAAELADASNSEGAIVWTGTIADLSTAGQVVVGFGDTDANTFINLWPSSGKIGADIRISGTAQWLFTTDNTFSDDAEYTIALVHDGTAPVLYVNGALQAITFSVSTDKTKWFSGAPLIDNCRIGCYNNHSVSNAGFAETATSRFSAWNHALSADEVKALSSGGSVPYKYKDADQTAQTSGTLTIGKAYRITTFVAGDDFTNAGAASNASGVEFVATGTTPTTWTNSSSLDNIGAVAEYDGSTMSAGTWHDKSGNGLDGAVTGASLENTYKALPFETGAFAETAANTLTVSGFTTWDFGAVDTINFDGAVALTAAGNANQLYLATDGSVGFGVSSTDGQFHVEETTAGTDLDVIFRSDQAGASSGIVNHRLSATRNTAGYIGYGDDIGTYTYQFQELTGSAWIDAIQMYAEMGGTAGDNAATTTHTTWTLKKRVNGSLEDVIAIDRLNYVGIGVTSPGEALDVSGNMVVSGGFGMAGVSAQAQQAHIADADGTLADITAKFNTLLADLEGFGFLATS